MFGLICAVIICQPYYCNRKTGEIFWDKLGSISASAEDENTTIISEQSNKGLQPSLLPSPLGGTNAVSKSKK